MYWTQSDRIGHQKREQSINHDTGIRHMGQSEQERTTTQDTGVRLHDALKLKPKPLARQDVTTRRATETDEPVEKMVL